MSESESTDIAVRDHAEESQDETALATVAPVKSAVDYRVESVAHALDPAYAKASTLQLTTEEADALAADFPDEAFRLGAGGDPDLLYIEHAYLRERLNTVLGVGASVPIKRNQWSEDFKYWKSLGDRGGEWRTGVRIYVELVLLVRGCLVGEAIGDSVYYPDNAKTNYSDALEGAKSNAFRRTCKEFGVGLQVWKKGFVDEWKTRNRGPQNRREQPQRTQNTAGEKATERTERKAPEKFREPANWPESTRYDVTAWAETLKTGTDFKESIALVEKAKLQKAKTHGMLGIIADQYHKILANKSAEDQAKCDPFTKWVDGMVAVYAEAVVPFSTPPEWPNTTIDDLKKWIDNLVTVADMKTANDLLFGEDTPFTSLDEREVLIKHLNQKFHAKYDAMVDGDKAKYEAIAREIDETLYKHELDVQAMNTFK